MRNPLKRGVRYWRSGKGTWHEAYYRRGSPRTNERCNADESREAGLYVEVETLPSGARTCKHCIGHRSPT